MSGPIQRLKRRPNYHGAPRAPERKASQPSQAMDASVLNNPRLKALMEVSHSNLDLKRTSDVISDSPLSGSDLVDAI